MSIEMPVGGKRSYKFIHKDLSQKVQLPASTSPGSLLTVSAWLDAAASVCSLNQALPVFSDGRQENLFCCLFAASIYSLLDSFFHFYLLYI